MKPTMRCTRYGEDDDQQRRNRAPAARAARRTAASSCRPRNRMPIAIDDDHDERAEVGLAEQQPADDQHHRRTSAGSPRRRLCMNAPCAPCSRRRTAPRTIFISSEGCRFAISSEHPAAAAVHLAPDARDQHEHEQPRRRATKSYGAACCHSAHRHLERDEPRRRRRSRRTARGARGRYVASSPVARAPSAIAIDAE